MQLNQLKQKPSALGGAVGSIVRGNMISGLGLVAYPVEYGNSGVMTFIVNRTGTVFQKDLGPQITNRADLIASFNPDVTWPKVTVQKTK